MLQRNVKLQILKLSEQIRKGSPDSSIRPDRLFGSLPLNNVNGLQQAPEEAENHDRWHSRPKSRCHATMVFTVSRPTPLWQLPPSAAFSPLHAAILSWTEGWPAPGRPFLQTAKTMTECREIASLSRECQIQPSMGYDKWKFHSQSDGKVDYIRKGYTL